MVLLGRQTLVDGERVGRLGISFGGMMAHHPHAHALADVCGNGHGDGVRDQSDIEIIVLQGTMISPELTGPCRSDDWHTGAEGTS
jgi:hypothetical protein